MSKFWVCDAPVIELARELIHEHHPHLADADILLLFRDKATKKAGRLILGTASKISDQERAIAGRNWDFKIILAFDTWVGQSKVFHQALVDHELCHCAGNSVDGWEMRAHDLEEFVDVVERHGLWKSDLRRFLVRCQQLDLFAEESVSS